METQTQMKNILEFFDFFCGWNLMWLIFASLLSAIATGIAMFVKWLLAWKRKRRNSTPEIFEIILGEYDDRECDSGGVG